MDHLSFNVHDENGAWSRIADGFNARLPLRNLIWRGGPTQAPRFIEQLNIRVAVNSNDDDSLENDDDQTPLLHLYIVDSDTDADTYKGVVRPRAKNWVAKVSQRRGSGWLIVYVPGTAEVQKMAVGQGSFLGKRTTTFDRLRSDFQSRKETRVVMLRADQVESWNALLLAVRDAAVAALEDRATALGDEIRRMDANRLLPGWNYCKFFVLKERLIALHRLMGLRAEALAQYDELEAVFFQLLDSQRLAWFAAFGGGQPADDFTDLLDTRKKDYRAQMVANSITIFDFRMYLFGCQCQLLVADELYAELAARAQRFISAFSAAMRKPGTGLSGAFVAAWTYSTCQNVVEICEGAQWSGASRDAAVVLAASKAEFLAAARQQLDVLGAQSGRLPYEFICRTGSSPLLNTGSPSSSSAIQTDKAISAISNPVLAEALASDERFDQIYMRTCEQATQYYVECGRRRFAQQQQADIAHLLESRGRWDDAVRVLMPLVPPASAALGAMDIPLLARLAVCEQRRGHPRDCLPLVLRLLTHSHMVSDPDDCREYAALLQSQAEAVALETPDSRLLDLDASGLFTISSAVSVDQPDALAISVCIESALASSIRAKRIEAVLVAESDAGRQLELLFVAKNVDVGCGQTTVVLCNSNVSCPGQFALRSVTMSVGHTRLAARCDCAMVRLGMQANGARVFVAGPASVITDGCPAVRLCVESRSCDIEPGMAVRLFDSQGRSLLGLRAIASRPRHCDGALDIADARGVSIDAARSAVVFADAVACNSSHALDVILPDAAQTPGAITVCAEFSVDGQARISVANGFVDLTPPLRIATKIGVLRGGRRVLQLRAQCMSSTSVRIQNLAVSPNVASIDCTWRGFLRPGECVSRTMELPPSVDPADLTATASYSTFTDAALHLLDTRLPPLATAHGLDLHLSFLRELLAAHLRTTLDHRRSICSGRIVCAPLLRLCLASVLPSAEQLLRRLLESLASALASADISAAEPEQRTIAVPVTPLNEQPKQPQCVSVTAGLSSGKFCHIYEPVQLAISLETTEIRRRVTVCLEVRAEDWLVSGPTRCEIDFAHAPKAKLEFTLVPLTVGFLAMPGVACLAGAGTGADADDECIRMQTNVGFKHSMPCVLPNPKVPTVYTVPVLVL
ncbi:hypothetical protein LPJ64_004759 [Coemansia asiatica]|uniref:Trafficking protein particle complex subunit 11 domain-containing protein n=1 Tax=Coemansia asiatica TaxID=1052880 RepID=A0A9W7XFL9_9FUNG|nr:hypothetical protein LPJ64_004759 [Coemansia asiatica]